LDEPIGIAGAGRVAQALGRLLCEKGEPVMCIASRNSRHAEAAAGFLGYAVQPVTYRDLPARACRFLIAVPDGALADVAETLAAGGARGGVALHTSGAAGPEALAALARQGVSCAAMHPLQTFADPWEGAPAIRGVAFAVWGEERAERWAEQIVGLLEGEVLHIPPEQRPRYHAAAVMASNYLVSLIDAAQSLMQAAGLEPDRALRALAPLARTSLENALARGPEKALTGPVDRGDTGTVDAHMRALSAAPERIRALYRAAGLQALDIARRRGLAEETACAVERTLRVAQG
jgi:predicted short-subunit dehydrogenase-like oxidoreductase (DUF2520 family)